MFYLVIINLIIWGRGKRDTVFFGDIDARQIVIEDPVNFMVFIFAMIAPFIQYFLLIVYVSHKVNAPDPFSLIEMNQQEAFEELVIGFLCFCCVCGCVCVCFQECLAYVLFFELCRKCEFDRVLVGCVTIIL